MELKELAVQIPHLVNEIMVFQVVTEDEILMMEIHVSRTAALSLDSKGDLDFKLVQRFLDAVKLKAKKKWGTSWGQ